MVLSLIPTIKVHFIDTHGHFHEFHIQYELYTPSTVPTPTSTTIPTPNNPTNTNSNSNTNPSTPSSSTELSIPQSIVQHLHKTYTLSPETQAGLLESIEEQIQQYTLQILENHGQAIVPIPVQGFPTVPTASNTTTSTAIPPSSFLSPLSLPLIYYNSNTAYPELNQCMNGIRFDLPDMYTHDGGTYTSATNRSRGSSKRYKKDGNNGGIRTTGSGSASTVYRKLTYEEKLEAKLRREQERKLRKEMAVLLGTKSTNSSMNGITGNDNEEDEDEEEDDDEEDTEVPVSKTNSASNYTNSNKYSPTHKDHDKVSKSHELSSKGKSTVSASSSSSSLIKPTAFSSSSSSLTITIPPTVTDAQGKDSKTSLNSNTFQEILLIDDGNVDYCTECKLPGEIICCDRCPRAYHIVCLKTTVNDEDTDWLCPRCIHDFGGTKQIYNNNNKGPVCTILYTGPYLGSKAKYPYVPVVPSSGTGTPSSSSSSSVTFIQETTVNRQELLDIVKELRHHEYGTVFAKPVDRDSATDYNKYIKKPMDYNFIYENLLNGGPSSSSVTTTTPTITSGNAVSSSTVTNPPDKSLSRRNSTVNNYNHLKAYSTEDTLYDPVRIITDIRLVTYNCKVYNEPGTTIWRMADVLQRVFETLLRDCVRLTTEQSYRLNELKSQEINRLPMWSKWK